MTLSLQGGFFYTLSSFIWSTPIHNTRTVPVDSLRLTVLEASERRPQQVSSVFARPVLGITMVVRAVLFVFDLALQEI
jgi:hypothetical protein